MLIIGIIVDPVHGAALRLLEDIVRLEQLDPALGPLHVVLLENPSEPLSEAKPDERRLHLCGVPDALINGPAAEAWERWRHNLGQVRAHGLRVECISRATQQADASAGFFGRMSLEAGRQPIAIARTMLQRYVAMRCLEVSGAVAWILDEDLRLTPLLTRNEQGKLSGLIHELRGHNVDVAISPILGAPPLPARSSIRVNLTDVLRHLERMAELSPSDRWPRGSEWRKWDLHVHSPASSGFSGDWNQFVIQLGNADWINVNIGKAGRNRHRGVRPHTRAKAMNPIDHPLGGGEGRSNGGRHPVSKTGVPAKGGITRSPRKASEKLILRRRKFGKFQQRPQTVNV